MGAWVATAIFLLTDLFQFFVFCLLAFSKNWGWIWGGGGKLTFEVDHPGSGFNIWQSLHFVLVARGENQR